MMQQNASQAAGFGGFNMDDVGLVMKEPSLTQFSFVLHGGLPSGRSR